MHERFVKYDRISQLLFCPTCHVTCIVGLSILHRRLLSKALLDLLRAKVFIEYGHILCGSSAQASGTICSPRLFPFCSLATVKTSKPAEELIKVLIKSLLLLSICLFLSYAHREALWWCIERHCEHLLGQFAHGHISLRARAICEVVPGTIVASGVNRDWVSWGLGQLREMDYTLRYRRHWKRDFGGIVIWISKSAVIENAYSGRQPGQD